MSKYIPTNTLSDEQAEKEFSELLTRLPNGGKFYKYRSFYGKKFDYAYDALSNGYLWFASPIDMNDKIDTTLNVDLLREAKRIENTFIKCKVQYCTLLLKTFCKKNNIPFTFSHDTIREISACTTKKGKMNRQRTKTLLLKNGTPHNQLQMQMQVLANILEGKFIGYEDNVKKMALPFVYLNENLRKNTTIYCVAERYDIDSMWAYYGNDNKGFCIEYDFSSEKFTIEQKRWLLNLHKINYKKQKRVFSFAPHIAKILELGDVDKFDKQPLLQQICEQYLIKNPSWKHEQEWRIIAETKSNRFNIDAVSALYIDEAMLQMAKGKKLLKLAKLKHWTVYCRRLNSSGTAFEYKKL